MSTPTPKVDLRPDHWAIVRNALRRYVPDRKVLVFGSRAIGSAKEYSDLDLAIMGEEPLSLRVVSALDEALGESDLPFKVDIVEWARIDEGFRRIIRGHGVVVRAPSDGRCGTSPEPASDWLSCTVAEACSAIDYGLTKAASNRPSGQKFLRITDIVSGQIDWNTVPYVTVGSRTAEKYRLYHDDIVLARTGASTGVSAYITNPPPAVFASYLVRLRTRPGFDGRFLAYYLRSERFRHYMRGVLGDKSAQPNASASTMTAAPFRAPRDPSEQRAIAHILGTLDDKIELNRRMNETLEAMARALFKSWFVDFDPVRAKMEGRDTGLPQDIADLFPDRLVDSEMGEIPEGWEVAPLGDLLEVNPKRSLRRGQIAPYLPMRDMPTRGHVPDSVAVRPFGSGMRFANGDTLVARITPCLENGKTAYVDFLRDNEVGWGSTEYIVLKPRPPLPNQFAYCLARSAAFREFAIQSMSGTSGRQRVPAAAVKGFLVVAPPVRLAAQFGNVAELLFGRANGAGRECRTLATVRDTLLPKLMSGEIQLAATPMAMEAEA